MTDFGAIFRRLLQTVRLERDAFVWMDFEDRASGDAALLVVITRVLIQLGIGSPGGLFGYVAAILDALIFWLIVSGGVWVTSTHLLQARTAYAFVMRVVGFAYPTLLLVIPAVQLLRNAGVGTWPLGLIIGSLWLVLIVAHGMRYAVGFDLAKGAGTAAGGLVLYLIVASILGVGF